MISEIYGIPLDGKVFVAPEHSPAELDTIMTYVETSRHIRELDNLFQIFHFQLDNLLEHFELKISDKIVRKKDVSNQFIAVNALTVNYISAGKALTEAIEMFLKEVHTDNDIVFNSLKKKILCDIYDDCFYYRLLLHLRNFAQHGHLPVHIDDGNMAYFDLNHFLNTPHYKHNATFRNEVEKIINDICEKYKDTPRIVFTRSIAEFNICIIKIYLAYLEEIHGAVTGIQDKLDCLVLSNPEIIESENGVDLIAYYDRNDTGVGHILVLKGTLPKILEEIHKTTLELLEAETEQLRLFPK